MRYYRSDMRIGQAKYSIASVTGNSRDGGKTPYGQVVLAHATETPNFDSSLPVPEKVPTELFTHKPAQITAAGVDPALRHALPTLVMLSRDRADGQTIMADGELSGYSSRLSRNAAKRGLPVVGDAQNPEMQTTFGTGRPMGNKELYDFDPEDASSVMLHFGRDARVVGDDEVKGARTAVRNLLRPPKKLTSPQFKDYVDVPLPGM